MENGRWAYIQWDEGFGRRVLYVDDADNATFRQLDDPEYGADKNGVYWRSQKIKNADPTSFRHISGIFWRDAQRVFSEFREIPGADPDTFQPLSISPWAKDKKDAYRGNEPMHVADIGTFAPIDFTWAKDAKAYYARFGFSMKEKKVPCDYGSFVVLNSGYAKDRYRAYWQGWPIEGSDPDSFHALNEVRADDKYRRYVGNEEFWMDRNKKGANDGKMEIVK
jgi:hypothetical protein